ncbi:class I SAM-dependent methyltransferase [Archangium violaceum]|uniref:class I SAM-dependent methyltransferase n=1 Tax=Archangium violaceum TaxID=83451 RepID=UPI0036DE9647
MASRLQQSTLKLVNLARTQGLQTALQHATNAIAWHVVPSRREFARNLVQESELARKFDQLHGVDTAGESPLTDVGVPPEKAARGNGLYRGIWPRLFHAALRESRLPLERFTFVDYGSGKGKALMLASAYAFRRIVGMEFAPGLHEVAVRNLRGYRSPQQRCFTMDAVCADALDWEPPAEPLLCFFFNPFDDPTMERVITRVARSWRHAPRDIYLLYVNVRDVREQARVFERHSALTLVGRSRHSLLTKVTAGR